MIKPTKPLQPNVIRIYAETSTHTNDYVSRQGFGVTRPGPAKIQTHYKWEGRLHGKGQDYVSSSSVRDTLVELAANLAENIKRHPSPAHNAAKVSAYSFQYDPKTITWIKQRQFGEEFARHLTKSK
jgi:hypothetical protein